MLSPHEHADDELDVLRAVVEGTSMATGEEFFRSLVRNLAAALGVQYALVAEFADAPTRVRTLAFWTQDRLSDNVEYELDGTPCEDVVRGGVCHHPQQIQRSFPRDTSLVEMGIESYLGVPLLDADQQVLGHLAVFDSRAMPAEPRRLYILHIFAARAAAELQRLQVERRVEASERRYRDLYDEAPIAYLSTGADGKLRQVNHRAAEWLGCAPQELIGQSISDYFADTPHGKPQGQAAFQKFLAGEEVSGAEMELRRKDGQPLWVSLWLKPMHDIDGTVSASRSIWVNITERVLAEQEQARLQQENLYLQEEIKSALNFDEIIGRSPALSAVLEQVHAVAPTDAVVLILGESGTGKELIARAIHSHSKRKDKPLIKVNCAALPAGLVESELFGHEKGAFTGAIARRVGRFELADGGTIFLDEVGELPLDMQAKLLRVLQEQELDRVGGRRPVQVNVRVIAATNRNLLQAVRDKQFREDLYYRLNVFPLQLPPLRERPGDIPLLAYYFASRFSAQLGKHLDGIAPDSMHRLLAYRWPGNVRELENIIERAMILCTRPVLDIDPKSLAIDGAAAPVMEAATLETVERNHIQAVLDQTGWKIDGPRGAAEVLDLHPNTLRSRMKKLGIQRPGSL